MKMKKAKDTKECVIKRTLKFEDYKSCLEANKLPTKNNLTVNSLRGNHKEFTKSNKLI